jgi:hypothetical protein
MMGLNVDYDQVVQHSGMYLELLHEEMADDQMIASQVDWEYQLAVVGSRMLMTQWMCPKYSRDGLMGIGMRKKMAEIQFW